MPKITKEASKAKEAFAINLMRTTTVSANQINVSVAAQFGSPLRTNRLYLIQREVRGIKRKPAEVAAAVPETVPETV